ncbi:MAG TPA: Gfo/Idh/MocA family oxidoreductase [Mycobacteriales bacterium]|nr:Gfo/Idh/MocA family oxidoreductase [Mycobacteriales bacterium]
MIRLAIAGLQHPHIETIIEEATLRDEVELVAVSEPDQDVRRHAADRFGTPVFATHTEMLDATEIDVIGVGAAYADRAQIIIDTLSAGIDVIADKPLCTTLEDLDRIEAAWATSGRTLSMALEKRFYPPTLAADRILASGELGRLALVTASAPHKLTRQRRPAWFLEAATYGGILNDLAVHDVDLLLHFSGGRRGTVHGHTGNYGNPDRPGFEDYGVAVLTVHDGPVATLESHWMSPESAPYHGDYRMRLTGTDGTAELLWKDDVLTVATHSRPPWNEPLPPRIRPAQDFFDALLAGRSPVISAADTFAATRVALLAQESARRDAILDWDVTHAPEEAPR